MDGWAVSIYTSSYLEVCLAAKRSERRSGHVGSSENYAYCVVVGPAAVSALWIDDFDELLQSATDVVVIVVQLSHNHAAEHTQAQHRERSPQIRHSDVFVYSNY